MNSLGVIGGLGPMATAYLLELITDMTDARTDQEHLDAIIFNRPSVPDRTAYILHHTKPSPVPPMIDIAQKLEALGVCAPQKAWHYGDNRHGAHGLISNRADRCGSFLRFAERRNAAERNVAHLRLRKSR